MAPRGPGGTPLRYEVLALRTPTLPPATTTNTMVMWGEAVAVVEPATPHPEEQRRLLDVLDRLAAEGRAVAAILLTHHHADHVGFARRLRDRTGAPIAAHRATAERLPFAVDRMLDDGAVLDLGGGAALVAVHTPGHAPGHLLFHDPAGRVGYAGDLVAGEGTILIDPDDGGDMAAYLASLDRARALDLSRLVPAHGPALTAPRVVFDHYRDHRAMREARVLAALGDHPRGPSDLVPQVYDDVPKALYPLAEKSLRAHLDKLVAEGRVEVRRGRYRRVG